MSDEPNATAGNGAPRPLGEESAPVAAESPENVPPLPGPSAEPSPHPPVSEHGARLEALVDKWWADHFPGSVVARYTECWNYAHGAKEALKALLRRSS
jgi:hypothetical protein